MSAPVRATIAAAAATRDLWQLVETDDISQLGPILLRGADLNSVNCAGETVLMRAAHNGRARMVKALIEHGADPNATRSDRFNPLMLAAFFGHVDVVKVLVECGADLSPVSRFDTSAEMWANSRSFLDIADYLRKARHPEAESSASEAHLASVPQALTTEPVTSFELPVTTKRENEPESTTLKDASAIHCDPQAASAGERATIDAPVVRTLKDPPEIWDLVHETPPQFSPGITFITRLTSSTPNLIRTGLFVFLVAGFSVYGFLKLRGHSTLNLSSSPAATVSNQKAVPPIQPPVATDTKATAEPGMASASQSATPPLVENNSNETVKSPDVDVIGFPARRSSSHAGRGTSLTSKEFNPNSFPNRSSNASGSATTVVEPGNATAENSQPPREKSGRRESGTSESVPAKKASTTTLSPQLIAPSAATSPAPKAKVIQWP